MSITEVNLNQNQNSINKPKQILITECPRDAMQGYHRLFSTEEKVNYINELVKCNFDYLDMASFVSPKAIPQMADSKEVIELIDKSDMTSKLIVITANKRGITEAIENNFVDFIGYPFSISETFQLRNTNTTIKESFEILKEMNELVVQANKKMNIYISMGFGNNYGDVWDIDLTLNWIDKIKSLGIKDIAIADTIGKANDELINELAKSISKNFPDLNPSFHLHSTNDTAYSKIDAAVNGGISKFDTAISGFGGCPFAEDKLVGNLATEILLKYCHDKEIKHNIKLKNFDNALKIAKKMFI